ncbi:MAG: protein-tyrosine phosphatase-like protein [Benniella sp.]|nr:MAG: protein-tyrosine phosphatase-like protein [Benniella sp.]
MDTRSAAPLPQLEQNGQRLPSLQSQPEEHATTKANGVLHPHHPHYQHPHAIHHTNDRGFLGVNHTHGHARSKSNGYINTRNRSHTTLHGPNNLSLNITPPNQTSPQPDPNNLLGGNDSSLSRSRTVGGHGLRRASFNVATVSLNFTPSTTPSMASPSSPSYSTLAVARARAAAAAAAGGGGQGDQGGTEGGLMGSGFFPGTMMPFSASPAESSLNQDSFFGTQNAHGSQIPPTSPSLPPSASPAQPETEIGSSSALPATHLQDNTKAEREVSMILDDFLFLGGELVEEAQITELENLGIKRVLNMAINCDDELWVQRFGKSGYLKVGLLDHVDQDLESGLTEAIKFIGASKEPVYVHCQAGKSRSVATVIGYLILAHQWPLKKAYDLVVERRRIMSPNIGFVSQLIMLESRVLGPNAGGLSHDP